jgi:hypothetical protein
MLIVAVLLLVALRTEGGVLDMLALTCAVIGG